MDNWSFIPKPGTHIIISIPQNTNEQITISTYDMGSLWDTIGKTLKESIQDIRLAREKARRIAPNLLSEIR